MPECVLTGRSLVGGTERNGAIGTVHIWEAQTRKLISTLKPHYVDTGAIEFSRDGRWLVTAGANSVIYVWSVNPRPTPKSGLLSQTGTYQHYVGVRHSVVGAGLHLAVAPSSREFASYAGMPRWNSGGDAQYSIKVWPMPDVVASAGTESQNTGPSRTESPGTRLPPSSGSPPSHSPGNAPAGKVPAGVGPQPRLTIPLDRSLSMLTYSPDNKTILVGFNIDNENPKALKYPEVHFFDAETGTLRQKWALKDDEVYIPQMDGALEFSPDGTQLLVCFSHKPTVSVWDVEAQRVVWSSKSKRGYFGGTFSPDGKLLALSTCDYEVELRRFPECELVSVGLNPSPSTYLVFSPDGKSLLTSRRRDAIQERNVEELLSQKRWGLEKKPGRKGDDAQPSIVP